MPVRQPPRRVILPNGELRRFRLPEVLHDEEQQLAPRRWRVGSGQLVGGAWLGVVAGCWLLVQSPPNLAGLMSTPLTDRIDWQSNVGVARAAMTMPAARARSAVASTPQLRPRAVEVAPDGAAESVFHDEPQVFHDEPQLPPQEAPAVVLARSTLPPVAQQLSPVHGGRLGGSPLAVPTEARTEPQRPATQAPRLAVNPSVVGHGSKNQELPHLLRGLSLNDAWRDAQSTSAAAADPFEEDFAAKLQLGKPTHPDTAPVKLERHAPPPSRSVESQRVEAKPGRAGTHVSHGGPGCQAAFDASEQRVDVAQPTRADVSSTAYAAALQRVEVLRCRPKPQTEVAMCVAVAEGKAVGVSVETAPGDAALGRCLVNQVRRMTFPVGQGVDLVRTTVSID